MDVFGYESLIKLYLDGSKDRAADVAAEGIELRAPYEPETHPSSSSKDDTAG